MKNLTDFRKTVETGVDPRLEFLVFTSLIVPGYRETHYTG